MKRAAVILAVLCLGACSASQEQPAPAPTSQASATAATSTGDSERFAAAADAVATAQRVGIITRIDPTMRRVYVEPSMWSAGDVQQKEMLARMVAAHFKATVRMEVAHICDRYTGKEIASYDPLWGFTVK